MNCCGRSRRLGKQRHILTTIDQHKQCRRMFVMTMRLDVVQHCMTNAGLQMITCAPGQIPGPLLDLLN
jgi:hypothetical protein